MNIATHRTSFITILSGLLAYGITFAFGQTDRFQLVQGKAVMQTTFALDGKTADEVYKDIHRWLVKNYDSPEDQIKARVDGEYLKGIAYQPNFFIEGSLTSYGLQYTYVFTINDQTVQLMIADVMVIQESSTDVDGVYRLEEYFRPSRRGDQEKDALYVMLNKFASAKLKSFHDFVSVKSIN